MEVKKWTYEEFPEYTEIPEGAQRIETTGNETGVRFIREALAELGVFSHEVRLKPRGESKWESAERRLKENFKGIDIDIK